MDFVVPNVYLRYVLKDRVDELDIINSNFLVYELINIFDFDINDIGYIFHKFPELLSINSLSMINNLKRLESKLNLKCSAIKYLVLKMPIVLVMNEEIFYYKLNLISKTFGCSIVDAIKLIYQNQDLFYLNKEFILTKVKFLCKELNDYGLKVRQLLRNEPRCLYVDEQEIINVKKCLMQNFTLSEEEAVKVIFSTPSILLSYQELVKKYNFYYPRYFIKRDLKEILSYCPEFLSLNEKVVEKSIVNIINYYSVKEKDVLNYIRIEPNILFYNSPINRFNIYNKYSINFNYIFSSPRIVMLPEITIPIKFVLSRILSLEDEFSNFAFIDTNLLLSRFLFMQSFGYYTHKDLLLNESKFYEKYNMSSKVLLASYKLTYDAINKICLYYFNLKDKIKYWADIHFPKYEDILEYVYTAFDSHNNTIDSHQLKNKNLNLTKRQFEIYVALKSMQLTDEESLMIINKVKNLNKFSQMNFVKISKFLKKYGFSQEKIIKKLIHNPSCFNYSIVELNDLVSEICEIEKCDEITAIEKFI